MFRSGALAMLLFGWTSPLFAADASAAMAAAKQAIAARDYDRALSLLQGGITDATAIADPKEHDDALAALHFYSAVAFIAKGADYKSRDELRQVVHFKPNVSRIDPAKYSPRFVKVFNEVIAQAPPTG